MGQTLTHGVYLPDEGERNCYNGLASNWTILDGAVGTVAEHTSALSGKAPLVHTHSKSDITDFPAYGNAAGTICEGNDARLSDARTPVAHTHTKSDVTDLLNSNFIPSANNSYDLGSSSYQWNNLYAKNYYYNGVAWGLDKANEWTNIQRMTSNPAVWYLRNNTVTLGSAPSSNRYIGMFFEDVNGADLGYVSFQANKNGYNSIMFSLRNSDGTNAYTGVLRYRASTTGAYCFFPENSECDLGTSTNKWKTLNGINPGALSLPNINYTADNPDVYNVGTDINDQTKNTSDPLHLSWTAPADGWLSIMWYLRDLTPPFNILITSHSDDRFSKFSQTWSASSLRWYLATTFPVVKNVTYYFNIDFQNTTIGVVHHAYLLPCLGNV